MNEIKDKVVLVTGGAAGIGAGVVKTFVQEGAKHVAILDVDVTNGTALENELNEYGTNKVKFYKCDVTSQELHEAYDDVLKNHGYIDVVINNAGIMNDSPKMYEKQIAVNVTALITSSLKAFNLMRQDYGGKGGTIINISSVIALIPGRTLPIYSATKSAVLQFSTSLGNNLHYERTKVRVITICFGCTKTSLFSPDKLEGFDKETNDLFHAFIQKDSVGKLPLQEPESAVRGLVEAFKKGDTASTWLVSGDRDAEDITANVDKSFEALSQGVFARKDD